MLITIKGVSLKPEYSIETFVDIVEYKKRYEPHDKVTLTQYLQKVTSEDYGIDTVIDILFYPYAMKARKMGIQPEIEYRDVAVHVAKNPDIVHEVISDLVATLPDAEESSKKKPSKAMKVAS
jgi:hypothetical protein